MTCIGKTKCTSEKGILQENRVLSSSRFELFFASTVLDVCQDSSVISNAVIAFVNNTSIIEVNGMIVLPCMVGNV